MRFKNIRKSDPELYNLINKEIKRQTKSINMIASENFVSPEILEILGSELTNKYSEGYPGARYYGGNQYYDEIELLAQKRALDTFNLETADWAVNVQPYSGSPANEEVYFALLKPGETILSLALSSGGHLTHGSKASISGNLYNVINYSLTEKYLIDYKEIEYLAKKYNPKLIISGASAYPRKINFQKIGKIAKLIDAYHMADISHIAGLISAGLHPSPFKYSDIVTTTTHKTLRGPRGAVIFSNKKSAIGKINNLELDRAINKSVFPGLQGGPHNNNIAAIAHMFLMTKQDKFKKYQELVIRNSKKLADELKFLGFNIITGGTDNHLILVDLKNINKNGFEAEKILESANIIVNRNIIQGDKNPIKPSAIRLGTPYVTSIGFQEKEMELIANWIYRLLIKNENPNKIKKEVSSLILRFKNKFVF